MWKIKFLFFFLLQTFFNWLAVICGWDWSVGKVFISLLLRGKYLCSNLPQSSSVFLRISGEGFDCRQCEVKYWSYKAKSSESSTLDAPLTENSGALDVVLVVIIGKVFEVGVFKCDDERFSDDESKRDGRVVIDGCWTVTLTRGVNVTKGVGAEFVGFTLHLITKCDDGWVNNESDEFSSWPNDLDCSEKAPELDALEFLRGTSVWDDDVDDGLASAVGGISVDDATIVADVVPKCGLGAVVVPTNFESDDDDDVDKEGARFVELVIDEKWFFPVLSWSIWTPYKIKKIK